METLEKTFRLDNGDRVVVTCRISTTDRPQMGIDHTMVPAGAVHVSFVGDVIAYRHREPYASGQVVDDLPAGPVADLWRRWHLNNLRSHCAHQNTAIRWDAVAPCAETGYRAGEAWLIEPVPADVVDMIRAAMR